MRLLMWQTEEGQTVRVEFTESKRGSVRLHQIFSADPASNVDQQRDEWQGVLDGFAHHVARMTA